MKVNELPEFRNTTFVLDGAAAAAGAPGIGKEPAVLFSPLPEDLLPRRAAYRSALLAAVKKGAAVCAVLPEAEWDLSPDRREALCELLQYASALCAPSGDAARALGLDVPGTPEEKAELLKAVGKRFGFSPAVFTDAPLCLRDQKLLPFPSEGDGDLSGDGNAKAVRDAAGFREISPYDLSASSAFRAVGKEWMLICASRGEETNAMTASWGFLGEIWNKPAAVCFVRPQRYTYGFTEEAERFSLCFFGDGYRKELQYFGTRSGRDGNKAEATGMHYGFLCGTACVEEASVVLICRKMYVDKIRDGNFTDTAVREQCYPQKDYHRVYVCEVEHCFVK